jgi:ribosome biogenesis GTPase / thiamine phosphate phosphatase
LKTGIVIKAISGFYYIYSENQIYQAKPRGKLRHEKDDVHIVPGDYVSFSFAQDNTTWVIEGILPRKNFFIRPTIANLDNVYILHSLKNPKISLSMLDKYLAYFEKRNVSKVSIVFSKKSLLSESELKEANSIIDSYSRDGYSTYDSEKDYELIKSFISNNISCFVGQSGTGKTTLLNKLDFSFKQEVNDVSTRVQRGKHTTRAATLFRISDGFIADTPGFSNLDLNLTKYELATSYHDFASNSSLCKFNNCLHITEHKCQIIKLVNEGKISETRYKNYLEMQKNLI